MVFIPILKRCTPPWLALVAGMALLLSPVSAQDEKPAVPPAGEPPAESASPDATAGIHPDAVSSFQVRTYHIRGKKLWQGLLRVLGESGYPPEEIDEKAMRVKTSFVDFQARDYSEAVAEAAPRISATYRILQMNQVREGKVSLEGIVSKGDNGAVLSLRARILVQGLDQAKRIKIMVDRRSSGVIESDFMRKLEDTLELERR